MIRLDRLPLPCPVNRIWRARTYRHRLPNGRYVIRTTNGLSQTARNRAKLIVSAVHDQLGGPPVPMEGPVMVQGYFHPRRNRNGAVVDADAYTKHLLDCLAKAGVYHDDKQVAMSPPIERLEPKAKGYMCIEVWEI